MKAVLIQNPGDASQMYLGDVPTPKPKAHELLIEVKATAVNRADIGQREGSYPPPKGASPLMGLEAAGVVIQTGAGCRRFKEGDKVFGLLEGGGYAEYAALDEGMAMPLPDHFSFEDGAAIPEVFLTAYQALFWIGNLQQGERVLIHAGGSGVGTAAIQMAKQVGAKIAITAGSTEKLKACLELGADMAVNYKEGPFIEKIGERSVNVVLDFIGAPYWEQNIRVLAADGRYVLISTLGGTISDHLDLRPLLMKRLSITGTTLRARSLDYKKRLTQDFADWALPHFIDGRIKPIVDRIFPFENVQDAHRYMEANRNFGKIVLKVKE
ncbi:NAD(P)H-quinone oxidoreductase [Camelliibacillus cellulosilyticus]|uniref:NAD(P)H-quinone oxidoreductase n=1 Tax=Camelliibacillus cellulosilyticus TaxID=2174486 RepID=A0ABV9GH14_9BACL